MRFTPRDDELMRYLAEVGQAPIDVVAEKFFALDQRTGKANKDPQHAAERRIDVLRKAGMLHRVQMSSSSRGELAGPVIMLDAKGAGLLGIRPKKVHSKHRHHHFQTLRLVEDVRVDLQQKGHQVVRVLLEDELRAELLSRRAKASLSRAMKHSSVNLNDPQWSMPDAVVVVRGDDGGERMFAVEYLSSTYRDADFIAKKDLLSSSEWAGQVVAADTPRTAARARAVGLQCEVLS